MILTYLMTCSPPSEESQTVSRRPDPSSHQQPDPGSARRSAGPRTRTGRRPIAAQRLVPGQRRRRGVWPGEASRGAASEERCLLCRYLLRVPQGAGRPGSRARRRSAFPSQPGGRGIDGLIKSNSWASISSWLGCKTSYIGFFHHQSTDWSTEVGQTKARGKQWHFCTKIIIGYL